jgi:hypothetical protein
MTEDVATGKEPDRRSTRTTWVIAFSLALTVVVAGLYATFQKSPAVKSIGQTIAGNIDGDTLAQTSEKLMSSVGPLEGDGWKVTADKFIAETSPKAIIQIVGYLRSVKDSAPHNTLSVYLGETAGNRYKNKALLQTAAAEYIIGRFVPRDLARAREILDRPLLQDDSITDYFLGLWWHSSANPERDEQKANSYFQRAADAGLDAAIRTLAAQKPAG